LLKEQVINFFVAIRITNRIHEFLKDICIADCIKSVLIARWQHVSVGPRGLCWPSASSYYYYCYYYRYHHRHDILNKI